MEINVVSGPAFKKELKPLARKFRSLLDEVDGLIDQLAINPQLGSPLGKGCYKIRLAVQSKGGGKSGGLRVITYVVVQVRQRADGATTVYLASIYDKSEQATVTDARLKMLIAGIDSDFGP